MALCTEESALVSICHLSQTCSGTDADRSQTSNERIKTHRSRQTQDRAVREYFLVLRQQCTTLRQRLALGGCQGRGCAEGVQPHGCAPFLRATLLFHWPYKGLALLGHRWSRRSRNPIRASHGCASPPCTWTGRLTHCFAADRLAPRAPACHRTPGRRTTGAARSDCAPGRRP